MAINKGTDDLQNEMSVRENVIPVRYGRWIAGISIFIVLCFCALGFGVWGGRSLWNNSPFINFEPLPTRHRMTRTPSPVVPSPVPTRTLSLPPTPTPITPPMPFNIAVGKDGMLLLYVPAGEFIMGSDDGNADEKPVRKMYLDDFWIDQTEVTIRRYAECVNAGGCDEPTRRDSYNQSEYYGNVFFDNYPVIYVNWNMASAYCEWVDRRLPTEAEWEKAARGENGLSYPWGNEFPNIYLLNSVKNPDRDTTEVGSFSGGASPYGALDMAGNVWEWVADWYDVYPNGDPDASFGFGETSRVLRGGAWHGTITDVRFAGRFRSNPLGAYDVVGFRCATNGPGLPPQISRNGTNSLSSTR